MKVFVILLLLAVVLVNAAPTSVTESSEEIEPAAEGGRSFKHKLTHLVHKVVKYAPTVISVIKAVAPLFTMARDVEMSSGTEELIPTSNFINETLQDLTG